MRNTHKVTILSVVASLSIASAFYVKIGAAMTKAQCLGVMFDVAIASIISLIVASGINNNVGSHLYGYRKEKESCEPIIDRFRWRESGWRERVFFVSFAVMCLSVFATIAAVALAAIRDKAGL